MIKNILGNALSKHLSTAHVCVCVCVCARDKCGVYVVHAQIGRDLSLLLL
jgi:hypothetical protein